MKAIILSAGQGRRLLPLTEFNPKCLLPVSGNPVITWQIDALLASGIEDITIIAGFQVGKIETLLQERYSNQPEIRILFNPFFEVADNLASCWIARSIMDNDFILLNGDTVIEPALLEQVLKSEPAPITLSVDYKSTYDSDDMKVRLNTDGWVKQVSKIIPAEHINAESIGLIYFRTEGAQYFRDEVEQAMRHPAELKSWYLSIIDKLAKRNLVNTCSVSGYRWCEIDFIEDLAKASEIFRAK